MDYRLLAQDDAGNASDFVFADVETPAFTSNVTSGSDTTYQSDDGLATVNVPNGALSSDANCGVAANSQTVHVIPGKKLVAGPYSLVCKTSDGNIISTFNSAISWSISLKNKLSGVKTPAGYTVDQDGHLTLDGNSKYDSKAATLTISSTTDDSIAVLAIPVPAFPWNTLAIVLVVLGIAAALAVLILRKQRTVQYHDYIRRKYYEI